MLIAGTEEGTVVVDLDWRGIVRRTGPRFVAQGATALRGSREIVTAGRVLGDSTVIAGVDIETGVELWRMTAARGTAPTIVDGVELGSIMITANPTRPEIFLWRSRQDGVFGIAGYDYSTRRITRFIGPVSPRFRAMASIPPSAARPNGCLVMALDADLEPGPGLNVRAALHVVCGTNYSDRDSIPIAPPSRQVEQMELSADGKTLLVMTDIELLQLDPATMQVTMKGSRPIMAPFFLSRVTGGLIIPDVGSLVVASTGIIYVLDSTLELASIVDLRVLPFGERPLGIRGAEMSRDGRWLYIIGGVARDGPLYGPEKTHILVIDRRTGRVADNIVLETYGGTRPILIP
jgi:hypothetical protein